MVQKGRSYGTWRAILDLAESVNRDLGPHTCAYSEEDLVKALRLKRRVGYCVEDGKDGLRHLGLRNDDIDQPKLKLDWDHMYGRAKEWYGHGMVMRSNKELGHYFYGSTGT